jgi:phosphatidylglycerophosphatase A
MKTGTATERRTPAVWIATVGGTGYFPVGPGTAGSAVAVGMVAVVNALPLSHARCIALMVVVATVVFFLGVWSAGESENFFGRTDPGHVVIDEVAGQMVAFLLTPHASWKFLLAGFGLFRLFDITKPFPAGRAERLPGGWGIMIDDIIAGVYAMGTLAFLGYVIR